MSHSNSLKPTAGRFSPWLAALLGIVAVKAVLSFSVGSVPFVYSYSGISYLLLLVLVAGFSIRNGVLDTLRGRPFWLLLAGGCGLWACQQFLVLYYELILHIDPPDTSVADDALFLHLAPFMAAAATLPNVYVQSDRRWIWNSLLIFCFWLFLYGFVVAPYKYFAATPGAYGPRFDNLYLIESLATILVLGVTSFRVTAPWRRIYLHLLGACALYAVSSTAANLAIDAGGYINGKLYGIGLLASACWLVWVPVSARIIPKPDTDAARLINEPGSRTSGWAPLAVVMIAIPMVWESLHRTEDVNVRKLRLIVASATVALLAGGSWLKEYFENRELAAERKRADLALRASEERFRLAAEAGRMYAVDWDAATDAMVRSGNVQEVVGVSDEELGPTLHGFMSHVHPDDQDWVAASLRERDPDHPTSQIQYRLVRPDGSIVWLERTDQAFFDSERRLVRMMGMLSNITERKQAEHALRESEEKFRRVFLDSGVGMIIVSREGCFLAANATFCGDLGYTEEELLTQPLQSIVCSDDWTELLARLEEAIDVRRGFRREEVRCLHKSGRVLHTECSASWIKDSEGPAQFFVAQLVDITARKESEQALAAFNGRLIQAQEEERTRIARELHDDISQRVALLAIRLGMLKAAPGGLPDDMLDQVSKTQQETAELSLSIQHLSHELHSSTLKIVGLSAAIRSWCGEFGEKRNLDVSFVSEDVPAQMPAEVSLHLYRVMQEALNNAAKYSGSSSFDVRLWGTPGEIHLSVADSGKGFDVRAVESGRGLGLKSMRERMRLIDGSLAIESESGCGTTIHACVPVKSDEQAATTASQNIKV
ncbi:PAS domain-containing sensor histidine kinase [Occallatibacter riparius]|uniref:Oxygen sensor histidine kinase NreB n=1 Tax=Occallatibacter riparius TaxID=1002689 RepID=A0A9J7BM19_9BACT|nr:PAS domain-containing sensor histidine kinase [Occallatibacter riparius]UWZ83537.1 PAS domain S-box protein [Occallatibacter riparius]